MKIRHSKEKILKEYDLLDLILAIKEDTSLAKDLCPKVKVEEFLSGELTISELKSKYTIKDYDEDTPVLDILQQLNLFSKNISKEFSVKTLDFKFIRLSDLLEANQVEEGSIWNLKLNQSVVSEILFYRQEDDIIALVINRNSRPEVMELPLQQFLEEWERFNNE